MTAAAGQIPFFILFFYFLFIYFCLFAISRAASVAYGGSQARGQMGAVAAGLCQSHSNTDLSHVHNLHDNS